MYFLKANQVIHISVPISSPRLQCPIVKIVAKTKSITKERTDKRTNGQMIPKQYVPQLIRSLGGGGGGKGGGLRIAKASNGGGGRCA